MRREVRHPNRSWLVDDIGAYCRQWSYLYRAVDSTEDTIDFVRSPKRGLIAAKLFLRLALSGTNGVRPRVINVDGRPAYACAIAELKESGDLSRRKRITASLGFRSVDGAWRTIEGYEAMHMIRKGQIRRLGKEDAAGQRQFIHNLFGIAA